jgi:hypothetical protein
MGNGNFYIKIGASEVSEEDGDGWADVRESASCAHTNLRISGLCIPGSVLECYNRVVSLSNCLIVLHDTNCMDEHTAVADRPRSVVALASRMSLVKR